MKKFGFTLSELVVTLAIIGVASAMVAPSIVGLMPDKHKAKVLRYNSSIDNAIVTIMNNKGYFQIDPETAPANYVENLRNDLRQALKLTEGGVYTDGSVWTLNLNANGGTITIDTEPDNNKGVYSAARNRLGRIDTFVFQIDDGGNVLPGDALTSAYLSNPLKMNDSKADLATAADRLNQFRR